VTPVQREPATHFLPKTLKIYEEGRDMQCIHGHPYRGPQDRDRWGCIRCRRDRQRRYQAECRDARRQLRAL